MYEITYLSHHGVQGMKWGVRRYQNKDGTLTAAGKKRQEQRTESNRKSSIAKGTKLYRVSDSDKSDTSSGKIYVSATKKSGDFYVNALGSGKIYKTGKAYVHEYIAKTELKMPDKRTMEKIELKLLSDKQVQKELVDSLMKKGMSREAATEQVAPYSAGKAFCQKAIRTFGGMYIGGMYGAVSGGAAAGPAGVGVGAAAGAAVGAAVGASGTSAERNRALNVVRVSYGDKSNKVTNQTLQKQLANKGYNAMKDYNDRRAFGKEGKQAVIVFDSKNNLSTSKISEITSKDYAKAYAKNYLKEHPKSKLDYNDLLKDGYAKYKQLYESGVVNRARQEENKRILEEAKKKSS